MPILKSTLHYWLQDIPSKYQTDPKVRLEHLAKARILATAAIKSKRLSEIGVIKAKVDAELKDAPLDNILVQKVILSFLYWAEGGKTVPLFIFTNTDPGLCLLFITLMRRAYKIEEKNIRIRLYLHHYHNVSKSRIFWSKLLDVPQAQFEKTYIKSRKKTKKKKKNFAGICFIKYGKGGANLKEEVLYYAKSIQEKLSPVAMRP